MLEPRITGINRVNPVRSKDDRVWAAATQLNRGDWYVPHSSLVSWVDEFLFELSAFPHSKHDDWADAWSPAGELTGGVDYSMYDRTVNVLQGLRPPYFRNPWGF